MREPHRRRRGDWAVPPRRCRSHGQEQEDDDLESARHRCPTALRGRAAAGLRGCDWDQSAVIDDELRPRQCIRFRNRPANHTTKSQCVADRQQPPLPHHPRIAERPLRDAPRHEEAQGQVRTEIACGHRGDGATTVAATAHGRPCVNSKPAYPRGLECRLQMASEARAESSRASFERHIQTRRHTAPARRDIRAPRSDNRVESPPRSNRRAPRKPPMSRSRSRVVTIVAPEGERHAFELTGRKDAGSEVRGDADRLELACHIAVGDPNIQTRDGPDARISKRRDHRP